MLAGLAARPADRDGLVKSTESDFVWACRKVQILPLQPTPIKIHTPLAFRMAVFCSLSSSSLGHDGSAIGANDLPSKIAGAVAGQKERQR